MKSVIMEVAYVYDRCVLHGDKAFLLKNFDYHPFPTRCPYFESFDERCPHFALVDHNQQGVNNELPITQYVLRVTFNLSYCARQRPTPTD